MRVNTFVCLLFSSFATLASAQEDPGPSPTESVGCEPHGDHWHCDGPAAVPQTAAPVAAAAAEDPGPSPTESAGCEPHGDHWHCDGPAVAAVPQTQAPTTAAAAAIAVTTPTATASTDDHDHEEAYESGATPATPSPTESAGCEPHGDHWHCDGPATAAAVNAGTTPTATAYVDDHDHESEASGVVPAVPSPTESAGCEPHGDHWHCEGPATGFAVVTGGAAQPTGSNGTVASASPSSSAIAFEGAASSLHIFGAVKVAGIVGALGLIVAL